MKPENSPWLSPMKEMVETAASSKAPLWANKWGQRGLTNCPRCLLFPLELQVSRSYREGLYDLGLREFWYHCNCQSHSLESSLIPPTPNHQILSDHLREGARCCSYHCRITNLPKLTGIKNLIIFFYPRILSVRNANWAQWDSWLFPKTSRTSAGKTHAGPDRKAGGCIFLAQLHFMPSHKTELFWTTASMKSEPFLFSSLFLQLPSPEDSGTCPEGTKPKAWVSLALPELVLRMVHTSS